MKPWMISGIVIFGLAFYIGKGISSNQNRRISQLQQQLLENTQTSDLESQISKSLKELKELRKRFCPTLETEFFIQEVGKLADKEGISLTSITPAAPRVLGDFTQLSVTIRFETDYNTLGRFISVLENSYLYIRIEHADISVSNRNLQESIEVSLLVSALYASKASYLY